MLTILSITLALIALALLIKKKKASALICVALMLAIAIARPYLTPSTADRAARFDRKTKEVLADVLAQKVLERHPGARVALVVGPEIDGMPAINGPRQKGAEDRLTAAFRKLGIAPLITPLPLDDASRKRLVESLAQTPDDFDRSRDMAYHQTMMAIQMKYDINDINEVLRNLKGEVDVVVWTPLISKTIQASQLLSAGSGPELVLVKSYLDDVALALRVSVLDMYLTYRPNASWEIDYVWPADEQRAFDERYVIATRDRPAR